MRDDPLARENFCILPWTHLHVWPAGDVFPCCSYSTADPVGDTRASSLQEIWNGAGMRALRRDMLAGRPSAGCSRCYELEAARAPSLRTDMNRKLARHVDAVAATDADGRAAEMRMPYLDVRFSNLCNLRCRTCGPELSSAWHDDGRFLGAKPADRILSPTADPEELWRQLEPFIPTLEEVFFAGGEPLLMEQHYRILEILERRKRFDVRLRYSTNFSRVRLRGWDAFEFWKRFADVSVGASLDASGKRGEYLRAGLDWSEAVANRRRMQEVSPKTGFYIAATASAMNALHLPDFHREWVEAGLIGPGDLQINLLTEPAHWRVQILPPRLKDQVRRKCRDHIDGFLARHGAAAETARAAFESLLRFMDAQDLSRELPSFGAVTRALDERRGESFVDVFPELRELVAS